MAAYTWTTFPSSGSANFETTARAALEQWRSNADDLESKLGSIADGTIDAANITVGSGKTLNVSEGMLTLANDQILGDKIHGGTISAFASTGIDDNATATAVTIDSAGKVGIGTASTETKLKVVGDSSTAYSATALVDEATTYDQISILNSNTAVDSFASLHFTDLGSAGNATARIALQNQTVGDGSLTFSLRHSTHNTTAQEKMRITSAGNVGIGTTSPVNKLDVEGAVAIGASYSGTSTAPTNGLIVEGNVGIGTASPGGKLDISAPYSTSGTALKVLAVEGSGTATSDAILFKDDRGYAPAGINTGNSVHITSWFGNSDDTGNILKVSAISGGTELPRMVIKGYTGNVGIGTTAPVNKLDVEGAVAIGASYSGTSTAPTNGLIVEGNVGIGTASPGAKLTVLYGNIGISQNYSAPQQFFGGAGNLAGTNTTGGVITVFGHAPNAYTDTTVPPHNGTSFVGAAGIVVRGFSESGEYRGSLEFFTETANVPNTRMLISHNGNVGIGTTSPANKLDVEGAVAIGATYSGTSTAPTNGLIVEGNVGIGTSSPGTKLEVSLTAGSLIRIASFLTPSMTDTQKNYMSIGTVNDANSAFILSYTHHATEASRIFSITPYERTPNGTSSFNLAATGNVGIGVVPVNKLDVEGAVAIGASYSGTSTAPTNGLIVEGNVGIGTASPTAKLHLPASTAAANTASLKITPGIVATTPVSGNIESDGTHLWWTDSGGTRRQLDN